jgi:hypothetical protein
MQRADGDLKPIVLLQENHGAARKSRSLSLRMRNRNDEMVLTEGVVALRPAGIVLLLYRRIGLVGLLIVFLQRVGS